MELKNWRKICIPIAIMGFLFLITLHGLSPSPFLRKVDAEYNAYVTIKPLSSPQKPYATFKGDVVEVKVEIVQNPFNIYAFMFILQYNTKILDFSGEYEFPPYLNEPYNVTSFDFDESRGIISVNVTSYSAYPKTGGGVIAKFKFEVTEIGESAITLTDCKFIDEQGKVRVPNVGSGYLKAYKTLVVVEPHEIFGVKTFSVNITVIDVVGLYGWEFKLFYLKSVLNLTRAEFGPFLKAGGQTFTVDKSDPDYNATHGVVWLAESLLGAPKGVNGSGVLADLEFNVVGTGASALDLKDVKLSNERGLPLDCGVRDSFFSNVLLVINPSSLIDPEALPEDIVKFNVSIVGARDINQYEFTVKYDTSVLQCLNVTFPEGHLFEGLLAKNQTSISRDAGTVWVKASLPIGEGRSGNGTLVSLFFKVTGRGESRLLLQSSILYDKDRNEVSHGRKSAKFRNWLNVKTKYVEVKPETAHIGEPISINVAVINIGARKEEINVTVRFVREWVEFFVGDGETVTFNLRGVPVRNGSEQIWVNNETQPVESYLIDYVHGNLTFNQPLEAGANITVRYIQDVIFNEKTNIELDVNEERILNFEGNVPFVLLPGSYKVEAAALITHDDDLSDNIFLTTFTALPPCHDIAILNLDVIPRTTTIGETVHLTVYLKNEGIFMESFNVSLYIDDILIDMKTVTNLPGGYGKILTFKWDTDHYSQGIHKVGIVAEKVTGEVDTDDNFIEASVTLILQAGMQVGNLQFLIIGIIVAIVMVIFYSVYRKKAM